MTQYTQIKNYEATELEGEWVILNTDHYTITKLNEVGGFCWSLLREPQSVESLIQAVVTNFSSAEDRGKMKQDIEEFLTNLLLYGLIQHAD